MFLTNDAETIRAMPTMAYARVIYCVVILMKLSISSSVPSSELSKILDPQDLNVDYYLGKILVQLGAVATLDNQGKHVLASQFLNILSKLKMWYDSLKRQQAPKNDQKVAFDPKQQQNGVPGPNSMPGNGTRFLPRSATFGLAEEDYDFSKPPWSNGESFFTDFSKGPGDGAHDSPDTQSMRAPLWPNQLQQNFNYSEVESLFPSSNIPFDFPMEVDPNMFTHFMDAGISQNGQTWLPTEGSGMAYTNMPEFNWGNASS